MGNPGRPRKATQFAGQTSLALTTIASAPPGQPTIPSWLSATAKGLFKQLSKELFDMGVLCVSDQGVLALYCDAYARYQLATKEVQRDGITLAGAKGGRIKNPACSVQANAHNQMLQAARELGLTPNARNCLKITEQNATENKWDEFE